MINLTPAFALDMAGIQNDVNYMDNYAHSGFWYKFGHFFSFTNAIADLCSKIADFANEIPYQLQRGMEVMPKVLESRKELDQKNEKRNSLAVFYANNKIEKSNETDTKEINPENNGTKSDNLNSTNLTSNTSDIHHTKLVNTENLKTNSSNPNENKSSLKSKSSNNIEKKLSNTNESSNTTSTTKKSSTTKNSITKNPPKEAVDHANYIKNLLISEGIDVNIVNRNLDDIQKDDIIQLVDFQGFIKYMVYEGTTTQNNESAVILYNGVNDQIVNLHKFQKAYSGEILQLTSNNDPNTMSTDVADEIYSDTINILSTKMSTFHDWIGVGNALAWIGAAITALAAILTCVAAIIIWCFGEKVTATVVNAVMAILAICVMVGGALVLASGLVIIFVLQKNLDDTTAEYDDLKDHSI